MEDEQTQENAEEPREETIQERTDEVFYTNRDSLFRSVELNLCH